MLFKSIAYPSIKMKASSEYFLYNNAHQSTIGIVDDLLHGLLKLYLALFSNLVKLAADTIFHQLFDGLSENIDLPDTFFLSLSILNILNQISGLFLTAYDRCDLCLNICPDHMDRRRFCL